MTFPDLNSNGIPDAFENRLSITEILHENEARQLAIESGTALIEIELRARWPKEGEIFIADGCFYRASRDLQYLVLIVRRVVIGDVQAAAFR